MNEQYYVSLVKVTSFIIGSQQNRKAYTGTPEELAQAYKNVTRYNICFGFISIFGIFWAPMALRNNKKAYQELLDVIAKDTAGK